MRFLPLLVLLAACGEEDATENLLQPAVPGQPSGTCPNLSENGLHSFESNGLERRVQVFLPSEMGPGKPVIFVWHPLGDSGNGLSRYLGMEDMADDEDTIVIVPRSGGNIMEWGFLNGGEDDLALFDDVLACLHQEHEVDLRRVYATGFSAGGLWTTFLSIHRSDSLAASLIFSGGTEPIIDYDELDYKLPVLQAWGGPTDTWGIEGLFNVEFEATTLAFEEELVDDGHTVVSCDHGLAHSLPDEARDMVRTWLFSHTYGEPSPFAEGELEGFPAFCERMSP